MKFFSLIMISLLLSSCCKEGDKDLNIKYTKLSGYASKYKVRIIRTVKGDYSKVIDTVNSNFNNNYNLVLNLNFSKETLPENPVNMPDFITLVYLRKQYTQNFPQDSLLYQDSISNIQYEVGRCNIENLSYEFNGVITNSREILIVE